MSDVYLRRRADIERRQAERRAEVFAVADRIATLTAERDAALAEVQRLREAIEHAKTAWVAFCNAPNTQDDEEYDALLRAMYFLARALVSPP